MPQNFKQPRDRCLAIGVSILVGSLRGHNLTSRAKDHKMPHATSVTSLNRFNPFSQKNSRRLELSISKNTPHGRLGQGPGSVDPRFTAGLPFPVPEILEFVAFRDSGKFFQQFSRDFPGVFLGNPRTHPTNSHSLLEFSGFLGLKSTPMTA